jgi:imidazolonepropionase-like amidohydrolase
LKKRNLFFFSNITLLAGILLLLNSAAAADQRTIAITGANIFDGTGARPFRNGTVVIRGERIVDVGPRSEVNLPDDAQVIDARGKWIIPGLIDAHVHFFQSAGIFTRPDVIDLTHLVPHKKEHEWFKERLPYTFTRYLCSGVTGVLDAGGSDWVFEIRERAARDVMAPRVAVVGPLISTFRSPLQENIASPMSIIQTPEDARVAVLKTLKNKPDLIKIWFIREQGVELDDQVSVYRAAIETSHAHGVRVLAHATELDTAKAVLKAGADILAHSVYDRFVDDEFIGLLKSRDVIYITTIVVNEGYEEVLQRRLRISGIEKTCGDPEIIRTWYLLDTPRPPHHLSQWYERVGKKVVLENLKLLQNAGITIAAGSDAGNIGSLHGPSIHRELELMADAGLATREILTNATQNAARVLTRNPDFGTIQKGKLADLVILSQNPLVSVRNLRRIDAVIKGGRIFTHEELLSMGVPPPLFTE